MGATYDVNPLRVQRDDVAERPRMIRTTWPIRALLALFVLLPSTTWAISLESPADDPVPALIARSDAHFKAGQKELSQGHFDAAKLEFNQAVEVLIQSAYGART